MPSRRAVLAALGAPGLVGLAGCAQRTEPPLDVTNIDIRQSFEWRKAGTHLQGVTLTDQQLVQVDIPASAGVPSQADGTLVVGEESVDPASAVAGVDRHKLSWVRDRTGVQPVFTLPLEVGTDTVAVRTAGGSDHEFESALLDRLQHPPRLQIGTFERSGRNADGDVVVTIAVENAGGHDARFRANLGSTVLSGLEPIDFVVPAGEGTVEELPVNTFTPDTDETIRLEWGVDSRTVTVPAR